MSSNASGGFKWGPFLFKVGAIAASGGISGLSAVKIIAAMRESGSTLSDVDAQNLAVIITVVAPTIYTAVMNRVKQAEWYKNWKATKAGMQLADFKGIILLMLTLFGCAMVSGCATKTLPDGTRETRIDTDAIITLAPIIDSLADRIERMEAAKAQAEAAGDSKEMDRLDKLIAVYERLRAEKMDEFEKAKAKEQCNGQVQDGKTEEVTGTVNGQ